MTESSTVYVVDDDPDVLRSVAALLGRSDYIVKCFSNAQQFLEEAELDAPGCLITDVQMPEIDGMELQRRLVRAASVLMIIVVTGVADVPTTVTLMEAGAVTLLEKPYEQAELLKAVERALGLSRERWHRRQKELTIRRRLAMLTSEERAVLRMMLADEPNKAIASALDVSMRTVDRRRLAVLEKMEVQSVPELAILLSESQVGLDSDADDAKAANA